MKRKIVRKSFKPVFVVFLLSSLMSGGNYKKSDTTLPSDNKEIIETIDTEEATTEQEYVSDKTEILNLEDIKGATISEPTKVFDAVLDRYNSLGNNLTSDNLGCATQNAPYLFKDQNDNYIYNITQNTDGLERISYNTLYVFTDNTNEKRPIAGLVVDPNGYHNVNVKNFDFNYQVIMQDSNKYVNFDETTDNLRQFARESQEYIDSYPVTRGWRR